MIHLEGARQVVGLDLSLTSTGIAFDGVVDRFVTKARGMERLDDISSAILDRVGTMSTVVIEGYSFGTSRQQSHAHALGELGGVVRWRLWQAHIPFVDVPPAVLKKYATGKGNARKEEMLAAAIRRLDYDGASNDEADALWLYAMGMDAMGSPIASVPVTHREALAKIEWPLFLPEPVR